MRDKYIEKFFFRFGGEINYSLSFGLRKRLGNFEVVWVIKVDRMIWSFEIGIEEFYWYVRCFVIVVYFGSYIGWIIRICGDFYVFLLVINFLYRFWFVIE